MEVGTEERLTFDKVWTMFQENAVQMKAMSQETEKKFQEVAAQVEKTEAHLVNCRKMLVG
jgi:hypothetical protein